MTPVFVGPSGMAVEEEISSGQAVDLQEAAAVQAAADAAAAESQRLADEAAARAEAEEQAAAEEAAASSSDDEGDFDDGYVTDGLESACAQGTASIEECFGPGSDLNDNGVADVNETEYEPEATEPDYPVISCDVLPDGTPICEGG
ncbi:hypothetical protein ASG36_02485 [Geodermatophilus sp. Leaf369]|nr:hypothetical protein ASG36_02485 [Geodermatophilus sp. Leaf369]